MTARGVYRGPRPFPADQPVWMRLSASDWAPGGWDIEGTVALSNELKKLGSAAMGALQAFSVAPMRRPRSPAPKSHRKKLKPAQELWLSH